MLVLASGIEAAFVAHDFTVIIVAYVLMRVAIMAQWLRASRRADTSRRACLAYATGIGVAQLLWLSLLVLPGWATTSAFVLFVAAELAVPVIAERRGLTPSHPHHITERYGLFTLILLGESLLASANAIIEALHDEGALAPLLSLAALALIVTAALWWIYFWPPHHTTVTSLRSSFRYGYVHYLIFAAAGAFSAGVEVEVDVLSGHSELSEVAASFTVTVPIAIFVLGIWWIALRRHADRVVNAVVPAGAVLVLLDPVIPVPITLTALIMIAVVVVLVLRPPLVQERDGVE